MSKVARGICDGRGPLRILLLLVGSHLTRIGEKVSLRLMELEDEEDEVDEEDLSCNSRNMYDDFCDDTIFHELAH